METVSALFPFALILVAFYLLIIRPARTRQRAAMTLQEQLAPGIEVMTTSGIFARVGAVAEDRVALEIAPGTTVWFAKAAVGRIVTEPQQPTTEATSAADDGDTRDTRGPA